MSMPFSHCLRRLCVVSLSIWFPRVLEDLSILKELSPCLQRGQTYPTRKNIFCQGGVIVSMMCVNKREHEKDP